MSENKSEVARIRAEIDAQYDAARYALYGPSQGSLTHEFINAKYDRIGELQGELEGLVGEDEAAKIIVEQLDKDNKKPPTS